MDLRDGSAYTHICSHAEIEVTTQICYLTLSKYTDTCLTSPSTVPTMSGTGQPSHYSLKALVYMVLWFNYNVMDVVNVATFCLVIISHDTNELHLGDNKNLLNGMELNPIFQVTGKSTGVYDFTA